jgi:hypothetical protein
VFHTFLRTILNLYVRYFTTWVRALELVLYDLTTDIEEAAFEALQNCKRYEHVKYIIDATELRTQISSSKMQQRTMFSAYKHMNSFKFLVAISLSGVFNFCSEGYAGRTSDTDCTRLCGFLDRVLPGWEVMADKGFPVHAEVTKRGGKLWMPKKRERGQEQVSAFDTVISQEIANVRIHVERGMARIKKWRTLSCELQLSRKDLWSSTVFVCTMMCNIQQPLVQNIPEKAKETKTAPAERQNIFTMEWSDDDEELFLPSGDDDDKQDDSSEISGFPANSSISDDDDLDL